MKNLIAPLACFALGFGLATAIGLNVYMTAMADHLYGEMNTNVRMAKYIESQNTDVALRIYDGALTWQVPMAETTFVESIWVTEKDWHKDALTDARLRLQHLDNKELGSVDVPAPQNDIIP